MSSQIHVLLLAYYESKRSKRSDCRKGNQAVIDADTVNESFGGFIDWGWMNRVELNSAFDHYVEVEYSLKNDMMYMK